jgi:hypothetical protein
VLRLLRGVVQRRVMLLQLLLGLCMRSSSSRLQHELKQQLWLG